MTRDASTKRIKDIIGLGQLRIPPSQRGFSWKAPEVNPFLEDIIKEAGAKNKTPGGLYFGTVIAYKYEKGFETIYDIYDGQQRITSIFITYLAIRSIASERGQENLKDACNKLITHFDGNGESLGWSFEPSVSIRSAMEIAYGKDWDGEQPKSKGRGAHHRDKRFYNLYKHIYSQIAELDENTFGNLKLVIDQMAVTFLTITETSEAYDLFERTNARGKPLEVSDLLKNELFKRQRDIENIEERWAAVARQCGGNEVHNGKITQMLRYYYVSKEGHIAQKKVFAQLKRIIDEADKANDILEEIESFASFYQFMIDIGNNDFEGWTRDYGIPELSANQSRLSIISRAIEAIKFFRVTQAFPLIYAAIKQIRDADEKGKRSRIRNFELLVSMLETFHASYTLICGQPGNKIEHLYADYAAKLSAGVAASDVRDKVASRIKRDLMPNRELFLSKFTDISYSEQNSYNKIMYIFDRYFFWNRPSDAVPMFNPSENNARYKTFQREHIYPQSPRDGEDVLGFVGSNDDDDVFHMVHNIGNLTVLSFADNSGKKSRKGNDGVDGVTNKTPLEKFEMLEARRSKNPYFVNRFLDDIQDNHTGEWNKEAIDKRAIRIGNELFDGFLTLVSDGK